MTLRKNFSSHKVALMAHQIGAVEKFVSSNNRQVDHENAQYNVEEATEGLLSFDHSDEHQEVSIGSV